MDAKFVKNYFKELMEIMESNVDFLIDLDSVVGDGDLGLTMSDGFKAAYESIETSNESDLGKLFYTAGKAMGLAVPSTMGTLMASGLMQVGKDLKDKTEFPIQEIHRVFSFYQHGVIKLGKAKIGEKTFLDGWNPAVESLKENASLPLIERCEKAYLSAEKGFRDTNGMIAVYGRAAVRGEASRSIQDPGAAVAMLMMKALVRAVDSLDR